jgi:hypothetical protein
VKKIVLAVAVAVGLTACSGSPAPSSHPSASPSVSIDTTSPPLPSESPSSVPILPGPPGTLLTAAHGTGMKVITVAHPLPQVGTKLTLRVTCSGTGTVTITDATGGLILGTGGCAQGVVFTSAWKRTSHDGRTIKIRVNPTTIWAVDLWNGNPAVRIAGSTPATA